ncbi:YidC/Oxa1 family membrane protein insertase [Bradyrhizobium sp. AZCC 1708]
MTDNRNTILAVILSGLVLIAWQYFYNMPQMERQRAQQQTQAELNKSQPQTAPGSTTPQPGATPSAGAPAGQPAQPVVSRDTAIAASPRIKIETPRISGSIALKGARIDDLALEKFRDTVDPKSPAIVLFSPSGTAHPYYAEFGWVAASGSTAKLPDRETVWQQEGSGSLSPERPVTLKWDNGEGLTFRRTIAVDDRYLFTIKDDVTNVGNAPVTLYPFALISRHGTPEVSGYYILHEGLIGYLGDQRLQEYSYSKIDEVKSVAFNVTNGWLGITDKYWASALLPDTTARLQARFSSNLAGTKRTYQTDYLLDPQTIAIGGTGSANARLFAGAKEASVVGINFPFAGHGGYNKQLGLNQFDLLIDWGWFYFITKPMFLLLDYFFHLVGNFGLSILLVTVLIKLLFFPLANKSYASMAKMKSVQPQLQALQGALSRRPPEAAAGDDGDLPQGEDQPDRGLPSHCAADSGVLLALQGAVRHHRNAPCAVLRLDKGSLGVGPDQPVQSVRSAAFRSDAHSGDRILPRARRLADHHGHHDVVPDEAEPDAAGSDPEDDLRLDAADLHLHAGRLPGGSRDLLGLEQPALGDPAELHHAKERREGGAVRQSQGDVRAEEGRREDVTRRRLRLPYRHSPTRHARPCAGHPRLYGAGDGNEHGWPG